MAYSIEDIKASQNIFYYLLENRELREAKDRELYRQYLENKSIYELVKSQADSADCTIARYGTTVYLIPNEDNVFLGFSKAELKEQICKSNPTDADYYLAQFIILTLLIEMYDSQGESSQSVDYIKGGRILNCVSERLYRGAQKQKEEENEGIKPEVSFVMLYEAFEGLGSKEGSTARTTKEGVLHRILTFLEKQGLIIYVKVDDTIKATDKLTNFMDGNLLNQNNYDRVKRVLGEYCYE